MDDDDLIQFVPVIESPCVNICRMNRPRGWCEGCGRTLAEIARWGTTDQGDRERILAQLPNRLRSMKGRA
jgi:predicted Fe-S protein YdhL (DUF1289 family)